MRYCRFASFWHQPPLLAALSSPATHGGQHDGDPQKSLLQIEDMTMMTTLPKYLGSKTIARPCVLPRAKSARWRRYLSTNTAAMPMRSGFPAEDRRPAQTEQAVIFISPSTKEYET